MKVSQLFVQFIVGVAVSTLPIRRALAVPGREPTPGPTRSPCSGAIPCVLENIEIGPLEFCIDIYSNSTLFGICVWELLCSGFYLGGIESDYEKPHELYVSIDDASLSCVGEWNVTSNMTLLYSGEFSVAVNDLSASTDMSLMNYTESGLPSNITFSNCSVAPTVDYMIHFLGGAIGKTLDATLAPKLEAGLEDHTEELFCMVLAPLFEIVLTDMMVIRINPLLEELVYAGEHPPPPPVVNGTYDWRISKLASIHDLLDKLTVHTARSVPECLNLNISEIFPIFRTDDGAGEGFDLHSLVDLLTIGRGQVTIPLDKQIIIGNASSTDYSTLVLDKLVISGLDTFTNISLLVPNPNSGAVLSSALGMESLRLELVMELVAEGGLYQETFVLTIDLEDVLLSLDLVVALSLDALDTIYVDQYLATEACVWEALEELYVSSLGLYADIIELSITQQRGDASQLDEDFVELIDNFLQWILTGYPTRDLLAGLGQTVIKDTINSNILNRMTNSSAVCPPHTIDSSIDYIVWNSSSTIHSLNHLLNDVVGPNGVNTVMTCLTNGTNEISLTSESTSSGEGVTITLTGLNSFYEFALLYPLANEPYDLGNTLALGHCVNPGDCNPFGVRMTGMIGQNRSLYVEVDMENVELFLDLLFMIDRNAVGGLTLGQVVTEGCLMTAVNTLMIYASSLSLTAATLYLDDGESVLNITDSVQAIIDAVQGKGGLVEIFNSHFETEIDTAADRCAGTYVPSTGDDDGHSSRGSSFLGRPLKDWTWQLALLLVGCALALVLLMYLYHYFLEEIPVVAAQEGAVLTDRTVSGMSGGVSVDPRGSDLMKVGAATGVSVAAVGMYLVGMMGYHNVNYDALVASEKIPLAVRLLFPIACLCTMAEILLGNLQIGTSVMVELDIGDIKLEPGSICDFRLSNTVRDMWFAGVYPLSILVAFFSGAWPYIKLFSMLVTWLTPTFMVSANRRGWVLGWLDILGKWSLIDAYVMVMMMVAVHVELDIAPGISVIVTVLPKKGFNNFLLATMISLGLGHIAMGCHRVVTEGKILARDRSKESMQNHIYNWMSWLPATQSNTSVCTEVDQARAKAQAALPDHALSSAETTAVREKDIVHASKIGYRKVRFTGLGKGVVLVFIVGAMLVVIAGAFLLTFTFHFKGLTGYLLKSEANPSYSLVTTGKAVAQSTGNPDSFNIRWIQAAFFGFGIAMPLAFLLILLVVWVMPLRLGTFRQLVVLAEVMNAWNAIDVFVLSVAAALLEIEQFAEFIIGDSCDEIDKLLKQYFDDQLNGDDTCFEVTASLKTDFWVLCFAASLMLFGGLPMLSVCHAAIRDRQITNRTADQSLKGVSMSQLGEPGVEVQNPLADASVGITQDIRGVEKDILLFGDRLSANVVHVLVSMCLMVYVDEDSVLS